MPMLQSAECNFTWRLPRSLVRLTDIGPFSFLKLRPAVASHCDLVNCIRRFLSPMRSGTVFRWRGAVFVIQTWVCERAGLASRRENRPSAKCYNASV